VALKTDAYYRKLAEDALRLAGLQEPPVEIERLAAYYAIPVRPVMFPSFFTGAIVYEDGLPVIILNQAKDEPKRREALAHMLGHVLLVLDDPATGYPRNTQVDHSNADVVGAELILPESMVTDQAAKWFNDHRYLARLFGVDEKQMMSKMLELGIIKQRGILWDY
jgi:hypothetical protein